MTERKKLGICADCAKKLEELLDDRMRRILAIERENSEEGHNDEEGMIGAAECFHLMEIKNIILGHKTCGVYDDYGNPPTIDGPLFSQEAAK